jgi:hypothetical protein
LQAQIWVNATKNRSPDERPAKIVESPRTIPIAPSTPDLTLAFHPMF